MEKGESLNSGLKVSLFAILEMELEKASVIFEINALKFV